MPPYAHTPEGTRAWRRERRAVSAVVERARWFVVAPFFLPQPFVSSRGAAAGTRGGAAAQLNELVWRHGGTPPMGPRADWSPKGEISPKVLPVTHVGPGIPQVWWPPASGPGRARLRRARPRGADQRVRGVQMDVSLTPTDGAPGSLLTKLERERHERLQIACVTRPPTQPQRALPRRCSCV